MENLSYDELISIEGGSPIVSSDPNVQGGYHWGYHIGRAIGTTIKQVGQIFSALNPFTS